jgi:hypothetical protein
MSIDISSTFFSRFHSISRNGNIAHLISAIQQLYWNGSLNIAQYGDFWVDNKMWEKRLLSMLCCYAFCLPLFSKHIHRFGFNDCRKAKHLFLLLIFWSSNILFPVWNAIVNFTQLIMVLPNNFEQEIYFFAFLHFCTKS